MTMSKRAQSVRSLSGELALDVWKKSDRIKFKQFLATDAQGRLRLEVISPFGQPITTLVSDGTRLMIYAADEKRFMMGAATPENMARLMPVNMSPSELSTLLRGSVPLIKYTSAKLDWNSDKGRYVLRLGDGERTQELQLEPEFLRVTQLETRQGETIVYRARFGQYSGTGMAVIPKRILFEIPQSELRADLEVVEFTLDPDLPESAFTLEPPRGIPVEPI